jgi:hypothetical protein
MKKPWFADIEKKIEKNGGEVDKELRSVVTVDPVLQKPVAIWVYTNLKVTTETTKQILSWVDDYAKLPAEKRRNEKGMSAWPVNR